ncbi:MAG: hypothetical protein GY754_13225 [bacterium]|nr:hypothetical protein [bacterium]
MGQEHTGICGMCGRERKLTFHHLIPRTCHRNKWFKKNFTVADMKTRGIDLCSKCHRHIHETFTEKDLGRYYNTLEILAAEPKIGRFIEWIRKQK